MGADILIGNGISLVAAFFTAKSSWARERKPVYLYQVAQCLLLALASVFFRSYTGAVSLLACALRNYLAAYDRLDRKWTVLCLLLVVVPGWLVNNRGFIGILVIAANLLYTLGMYLARTELAIKLNIIVNLLLWMSYEALILDIPSLIADGVGLITAAVSLLRLKKTAA